jgi:hypothetical protein
VDFAGAFVAGLLAGLLAERLAGLLAELLAGLLARLLAGVFDEFRAGLLAELFAGLLAGLLAEDFLAGVLAMALFGAGAFGFAVGLATALALDVDGVPAADLEVAELLAAVFGLAPLGGFTLAADLASAAGLALTTGLGFALPAGAVFATVEAIGTGFALGAGADLAAGPVFIGCGDFTGAAVRDAVDAGGLLAVTWPGAEALASGWGGSARFAGGAAAPGAAGASAGFGSGSVATGADEPLAAGRGPRSPTRTGSTMSCVSSAWRSGVSAVSRHVKATTSLVSLCLSNRTIAVWLNTVSTTPVEPTG